MGKLSTAFLLLFLGTTFHASSQDSLRINIDSLRNILQHHLLLHKFVQEDAVVLYQFREIFTFYKVFQSTTLPSHPPQFNRVSTFSYNPYSSYYRVSSEMPVLAPRTRTEFHFRDQAEITENEQLYTREHFFQRIYLNTEKGAEEYSKIFIPKEIAGMITSISGRTIKSNGQVIVLKPEDIKEAETMVFEPLTLSVDHYRFSLPGAEKGDIIEVSYTIHRPTLNYNYCEAFLNSYLPVIKSVVTLRYSNGVVTNVKYYNGLEKPEMGADDDQFWLQFVMHDLPRFTNNDHANPYNDYPFLRFDIKALNKEVNGSLVTKQVGSNTWGDFSQSIRTGFVKPKVKGARMNYFPKFISDRATRCSACTPEELMQSIVEYIRDSVRVEEQSGEAVYSSGYYLYNRSIDYPNLIFLIKELCDELKLEYYLCFSPGRNMARLDTTFISRYAFTQLFFAYRTPVDSLVYVFPENIALGLQADYLLPTYLGADVLLIPGTGSTAPSFDKLPAYSPVINRKHRRYQFWVDPAGRSIRVSGETTTTGERTVVGQFQDRLHSQDSMTLFIREMIEANTRGISVDSVWRKPAEKKFPYQSAIGYSATESGSLSVMQDTVLFIGLSNWLDHTTLSYSDSPRKVDYYCDYPYSELFQYYYLFPRPVELLNQDELCAEVVNNLGSYRLKVRQISDSILLLESAYTIVQDRLPAEEYQLIRDLTGFWEKFRNSSLLVALRHSNASN